MLYRKEMRRFIPEEKFKLEKKEHKNILLGI